MSTEVPILAQILTLLQKRENISFKVNFKTNKLGTPLTTISFTESTGIQSNSSRNSYKNSEERKKVVKKSPSRLLRDKIRQEAYMSRKAVSLDPSAAAVPVPPTTQRTFQTVKRRLDTPDRRLEPVGAGYAGEWGNWGPGEKMEKIPQLDGFGAEKENEERNCEDEKDLTEEEEEMNLRDEIDDEEKIDEKEEKNTEDEKESVLNALNSLNRMLENHLVLWKPR